MSDNTEKFTKESRKIKIILLGPAFIAAIGYIDPGNFATNIQAGAVYGYKLLWVVLFANIMAMSVQLMSAKLGIATGKNLAEHIRDRFPNPIVWFYWIQAEIIAMATDLAEFIGSALGFKMLFGISLLQGALITGLVTFLILMIQNHGDKPLEIVIGAFLLFVAVSYILELIFAHPKTIDIIKGMVFFSLPTSNAVFLATGILGATIMPHVIYLHSALTQANYRGTLEQRYASTKLDVGLAMTVAGFVNVAMIAMAAAAFHFTGNVKVAELDQAYLTLQPLLGRSAAVVFALSLIAAGISSTVVGTLAGQVVMQGLIHFSIPVWLRRIVTMLPSIILISVGCNPTHILVFSQVLLSFGITLAIIPLLCFTSNPLIMGEQMVNSRINRNIGLIIVATVVLLNMYLLLGEVKGF